MSETIADLVAPQLPYLRRFARALTGTQEQGDAYVVATLEMFVADPKSFRRDIPSKTAIYQTFLKVWNAMPLNTVAERVSADAKEDIAQRRIETLTPLPRQAFLLAAVEEFSVKDMAIVLNRSEEEVRGFVDSAAREVSEQIAARVLIIEDEPLIAMDIENLVGDIGHEVVGIATTRDEATKMAAKTKPGLVLADVQLADGSSGIDAVNDILKTVNVPVIFITAYPERLLTGERAEPTFLVTKPFKPEMVKAIISQALFFDMRAGGSQATSK